MQIDVFNGDADGICSLIQLRLAEPLESTLITGVKRDIELLKKVEVVQGDKVVVLDISLEKNYTELNRILSLGADVFYVDHHLAGEIPNHASLKTLIDNDANICTSLLINQHLNGLHKLWAIVGAFGDNMDNSALSLAQNVELNQKQLTQLKNLGICINYNGYGLNIGDLHFAPDKLYRELVNYDSPFDFMSDNVEIYQELVSCYDDDIKNALTIPAEYIDKNVAVYILPNTVWARRVSGIFSNTLVNQNPYRAYAVLSENKQGGYLISVRASSKSKVEAAEFCSKFSTGGGRKSAAGINHLPKEQLATFIECFAKTFK